MCLLNAIGCIYIFYRTWLQWKISSSKGLSMIFRLPFYTAISVWSQPVCGILSGLTYLFVTMNLAFYGTISVTTYIRVCRECYFDLGKYDYKLWTIVFFVSATLQLMWVPLQIYTAAKLLKIDSIWVYIICVIGIHSGGVEEEFEKEGKFEVWMEAMEEVDDIIDVMVMNK
ncbi:5874_t:CDS:2 [Diversispora eburnea]|uniref:5874_t:CDS:1 n=1 Tax=Diversispora eburnea TaxID=1213867 RepID=A0A9N8WI79_9GLOM|nr:5874_t:CDS:2 [Diversispora eburnea]